MSIVPTAWVLKNSEAKSPTDQMVLVVLADHAHDDGTKAFPSVATIAQQAKISERTVQYSLRRLEAQGCIRNTGSTTYGTNVYSITMEAIPKGSADVAPPQMATSRGADGDQNASRDAPYPSYEPPVEPSSSLVLVSDAVSDPTNRSAKLPEVLSILDGVAARRKAKRPKPDAVLKCLIDFPDKDHVRAATDLDFWLVHGKGSTRKNPNIVQTYRTFLQRGQELNEREAKDRRNESARAAFMEDDGWLESLRQQVAGG